VPLLLGQFIPLVHARLASNGFRFSSCERQEQEDHTFPDRACSFGSLKTDSVPVGDSTASSVRAIRHLQRTKADGFHVQAQRDVPEDGGPAVAVERTTPPSALGLRDTDRRFPLCAPHLIELRHGLPRGAGIAAPVEMTELTGAM